MAIAETACDRGVPDVRRDGERVERGSRRGAVGRRGGRGVDDGGVVVCCRGCRGGREADGFEDDEELAFLAEEGLELTAAVVDLDDGGLKVDVDIVGVIIVLELEDGLHLAVDVGDLVPVVLDKDGDVVASARSLEATLVELSRREPEVVDEEPVVVVLLTPLRHNDVTAAAGRKRQRRR